MDAYSNLESALQFSGLGASRRMSTRNSQNRMSQSSEAEDDHSSVTSTGSVDDDDNSLFSASLLGMTGKSKNDHVGTASGKEYFNDAVLLQPVTISLSETETIWLLEIPGYSVGMDPAEEASVKAANARYQQVLKQ